MHIPSHSTLSQDKLKDRTPHPTLYTVHGPYQWEHLLQFYPLALHRDAAVWGGSRASCRGLPLALGLGDLGVGDINLPSASEALVRF